jgi:methionine-rich copper-binding protein CopC
VVATNDAMPNYIKLSLCVLTAVAHGVAHIVLKNPVPYGNATLNNSPLDAVGKDFPCKQREGVYDVTQMNYWKVGETQTIEFTGSAVHGGGSCQFSITTDVQPTKASQWKVILSIIGGCPATADENLEDGEHPDSFELELPEDMPSGRYTLAWTWFNRRGDREMYMNCAPIVVSGATNSTAIFDTLPDMFVANLPKTSCATIEDFDYAFALPGDFVLTGKQANIATTLVGSGCESMTRLGAGAGEMRSPAAEKQSLNRDSRSKSANPQATTTAQTLHVSLTTATCTMSPVSLTTPPLYAYAGESNIAVLSSRPPLQPSCVPCDRDGTIVCIGDLQFGICNQNCAYPQGLAEGTSCSQGIISKQKN